MRLLLVRHGITQHNLDGLFSGQADVPLTELGQRQVVAVGEYLADEKLDLIASSDLQRARETATTIASHHQLAVVEDPELREINMSHWEGMSAAQASERYGEEWAYVRADPLHRAPLGGESPFQLYIRAGRALARYQERYADQTVLWATHGAFIAATVSCALKLDPIYRRCFEHYNTSVTELVFGQDLPRIIRLNDTAHLYCLLKDASR